MFMKQQIEDIVQKRIEHLEQQRNELLEALKKFVKAGQESKSTLEFSNMCDEFIEYAVGAIAKAEAAE